MCFVLLPSTLLIVLDNPVRLVVGDSVLAAARDAAASPCMPLRVLSEPCERRTDERKRLAGACWTLKETNLAIFYGGKDLAHQVELDRIGLWVREVELAGCERRIGGICRSWQFERLGAVCHGAC